MGIGFNLLMGVGGSLENFHKLIDLALSTHMSAKLFRLTDIRESIFDFLRDYMLDKRSLMQFNAKFLHWLYYQITAYDLPIRTFEKYLT